MSYLQELDVAVSKGSAESRERALWYATDLLIVGRYTDDEIWMFGEIIGRLEQEIETAETVVLVAAEGRIAHDVRAAQCVVKVERDRAPGGGGGFGKLAEAPHMQAATRAEQPSFARPGRRGRLPLRERRKETCSANRGTKCKAEDASQEVAEPCSAGQTRASALRARRRLRGQECSCHLIHPGNMCCRSSLCDPTQ